MKLTSACSGPVMTALLRTWLKSVSQKPWTDSHRLPDSPAGPSPAAVQPRLPPKSASFQVSRCVTQSCRRSPELGPDPSHTAAQPECASGRSPPTGSTSGHRRGEWGDTGSRRCSVAICVTLQD